MGENPIFHNFCKQTQSFLGSLILLQENAKVLRTNPKALKYKFSSQLLFFSFLSACLYRIVFIVCSLSPVRLNWRVHMHFTEAVHLGQSEASQLVSVQLLERKISLWFILQSCSDVQLTELLIHAPSGQFVHHLHCRAG